VLLSNGISLTSAVLVVWWRPCRCYRLFGTKSFFYIYICCFTTFMVFWVWMLCRKPYDSCTWTQNWYDVSSVSWAF